MNSMTATEIHTSQIFDNLDNFDGDYNPLAFEQVSGFDNIQHTIKYNNVQIATISGDEDCIKVEIGDDDFQYDQLSDGNRFIDEDDTVYPKASTVYKVVAQKIGEAAATATDPDNDYILTFY